MVGRARQRQVNTYLITAGDRDCASGCTVCSGLWLLLLCNLLSWTTARRVLHGSTSAWSEEGRQSRFLLNAGADNAAMGDGSPIQSPAPALPDGSYTLVSNADTFSSVITSSTPAKRIRLTPAVEIKPCNSIIVPSGSSAVVDCQGSTVDLRCASAFHVDTYAHIQFFNCHVLWPRTSDFFNIVADAATLRIEEGASLEQFGGSSSLTCSILQAPDRDKLFGSQEPVAGDVFPVSTWSATMRGTRGLLTIRDSEIYCSSRAKVPDTTAAQFQAALDNAVAHAAPVNTLNVSGLLTLEGGQGWNRKRAPLLGTTELTGVSPFAALDFRRSRDVFSLLELDSGEQIHPALLRIRGLNLVNLPHSLSEDEAEEARPGEVSERSLCSLLWIATSSGESRREVFKPVYTLEDVSATVSCSEVKFLRQFFRRLQANISGNTSGLVVNVMDGDDDQSLWVSQLSFLGIQATDYTITCKGQPRVFSQQSSLDKQLDTADPVKLADQLARPPGSSEGSGGSVGKLSSVQVAAICVGTAVLIAVVALLLLLLRRRRREGQGCSGKDIKLADSMSQGSDPIGYGMIRIPTASVPPELDGLSDRLITSAKGTTSSTEQAFCDHATHLGSDACPDSASSLDISKVSTNDVGGHSSGDSSARSPSTGTPSTEASQTSVICGGGATEARLGSSGGFGGAAAPVGGRMAGGGPRSAPHSAAMRGAEEAAKESLNECCKDLEDGHLEVEGLIAHGRRGAVFWGTWRSLEVAIKSFAFEVPRDVAAIVRSRVKEEAEVAFNVSHANVVNTLSHEIKRCSCSDREGSFASFKLYLIQEFCAGGCLSSLVRHGHLQSKQGGVLFERILMILRDVAAGMAFMHSQDIVHGDLHPGNVLLQVPPSERTEEPHSRPDPRLTAALAASALDSEQCTAKISNFGLSMLFQDGVAFHGSGCYAAPELAKSAIRTAAADAFAFGVIMWEVFVSSAASYPQHKCMPTDADSPTFPAACPFNYAVLALACMASNPQDRPPMNQVYEVLTSLDVELTSGFYIDWSGTRREVGDLAKTCSFAATRCKGAVEGSGGSSGASSSRAAERAACRSACAGSAIMGSKESNHSGGSVSFYTSVDAAHSAQSARSAASGSAGTTSHSFRDMGSNLSFRINANSSSFCSKSTPRID